MMIALHNNPRTTPAIRAEIAVSTESAATLAQRFGIGESTVYKWKARDSFYDASHTAHRLQTTLTPAQESIVVELRKTLLLPLDDLLAVTREFLCAQATRSGLDRCLRRHGVGNLNALKPKEPTQPHKAFKSYEPGFIHIDVKYLPQMPDETSRRYLFVAIDRATRWVFASREGQATGNHKFDQLCQALSIEHRLTKPRTPRTNGMVERFNRRIADVLTTHRFTSGEDLEQTLMRYVALYNHQLPQSALKSKTKMRAMKDWYASHPHLFIKRPYDHPGCDK